MHVCVECGQGYQREGYCAADGHVLAESADPLLGTEVLRYRLARLIGEGGMGQVYLGVQPQIGSRVAIKILSDKCTRDPELVERFFAEARAVNLIRHENIASVLDMAKLPDGRPFIVMEYVEGQTLSTVIRGGTAPLGGIVQVFNDVLGALEAAHAIGIVHRDLKPDNILVTAKGHAKVLDFGIAKLDRGLNEPSARTRTGALLGTPAYMAPEQISGTGAIDARTDIYAAGIVLFEAVTGKPPFAGATLFDLMRAHVEQEPPSPRTLRADVPQSLADVILTALRKQPGHRFQSATAMANALEHAAADLPDSAWRELSSKRLPIGTRGSGGRLAPEVPRRDPPPAHSVARPQVPRTQRRVLIAGLALVALAFAATIVVVKATRGEDAPASSNATIAPPPSDASTQAIVPDAKIATIAEVPPVAEKPTVVATKPVRERAKERRASAAPVATPHTAPETAPSARPIKRNPRVTRETYNPANFDYRRFAARAQTLARALVDDMRFTGFDLRETYPDGRVVLAKDAFHPPATFRFRSEKASSDDVDTPCAVKIDVYADRVHTYFEDAYCVASYVALPKCSIAQMWAAVRGNPKLVTKAKTAAFDWNYSGWTFGGIDLTWTLEDVCP